MRIRAERAATRVKSRKGPAQRIASRAAYGCHGGGAVSVATISSHTHPFPSIPHRLETGRASSRYVLLQPRFGLETSPLLDIVRNLVRRCLQGDQRAMHALVEQYQGRVFGLCCRMLGNRQDAEDATQETFIRVLHSLGRWDASREFEPWLLAIAANRCRTALSARQRRPSHQAIVEQPAERSFSGEGDASHLAEEVAKGIQLLRCEYREAFVLFHEHGLSYEQIAEIIQRPLGTIKTWIHRARRELMEYLIQRDIVPEIEHVMRDV